MHQFNPLIQGLLDNLGESAAVILLAMLALYAGRIKVWWAERSIRGFERSVNKNVKIRELLAELRVPYLADRVSLYQFHNGEYYHSGDSIMKCSLTHFVTRVGVANPSLSQNIPTGQMIQSVKVLKENLSVTLSQNTFEDDSFLDCLFTATGTQVVLAAAIRDNRKNWLGVVCVEWLSEKATQPPQDNSILNYARYLGDCLSKKT